MRRDGLANMINPTPLDIKQEILRQYAVARPPMSSTEIKRIHEQDMAALRPNHEGSQAIDRMARAAAYRFPTEHESVTACVTLANLGYTYGGGEEWKPPATRSPKECILAVLANLQMARDGALRHVDPNNEDEWNVQSGVMDGIDQSITLIQTECADILKETK